MKTAFILSLLLALAQGELNKTFCAQWFKPPRTEETFVELPPDYVNYKSFIEGNGPDGLTVIDVTFWYSRTYDLMQQIERVLHVKNRMMIFPKEDIYLISKGLYDGEYKCKSDPIRHSDLADFVDLEDPVTHELYLPEVHYLSPGTIRTAPVYIGKTTVRGIPVQEWFTCSVTKQNFSVAAHTYYSDEGVVMPGSMGSVPVAIDSHVFIGGESIKRRDDFNMFTDKVDPTEKALEIPAGMYCKNGISASPKMPKPVYSFQFESIKKELGNTNELRPQTPTIKYTKDVYDSTFSIYVRDRETVGSKTVPDFKSRTVHDYRTGLEYHIDLFTGECDVTKIISSSEDVKKYRDGFVKMAKPNEFFNLAGNNTQYMGKHRHVDRDIETDVYTTQLESKIGDFKKTDTTTYWLLSTDFLQKMGFQENEFVPLRIRIDEKFKDKSVATREEEIFHFTTDVRQADLFPDLSLCYSAGKEIYIDIILKGHYKLMYSRNPDNFQAAFGTAMMTYSGIFSPIRVARFTVTPADEGYTRVQFILLDKPSKMGNSETEVPEPGNDVVWPKLEHSLKTSQFQVSVHNDLGHHIGKAVRYGTDSQDQATFKAKKEHLKTFSDQNSGYGSGDSVAQRYGLCFLPERYRVRSPAAALYGLEQVTLALAQFAALLSG